MMEAAMMTNATASLAPGRYDMTSLRPNSQDKAERRA